jgi:RHS repeat-associated protein
MGDAPEDVSRKGRRTRSHPRAKRPGLALNRSTKCHPPGRGCGAGEPYDTTPDKNKGLVVERRAPGNVVSRFQYHWTGRIKQAQTINGGTVTTVDYEYDGGGNRFVKRTDLGGIVTEIHDLSGDYRVHADGSSEVHTIEVRSGNTPVARFRFQDDLHNSGVWAPSSLFGHRLGADLLRIARLEGGITKLPTLLGFAFSDAYHAVKLLPQIQNRTRLLVLLYWTFAAIIALAALTLLVRNWRKNPDEGPGLLPVAIYRFGSILALLSFSATGCIVVPQTQDGSEYLLAANGLFRGSSEGGESNIMSVLGAFYFISTHNGSTDIVTNADGAPVARFVYEPFGRVNSDLTDLDPDRNGIHYGETFMFTGQELERETGLYNYRARLYDPETGRFLQPDPVHTERAGFDNWDRYQYANNNPVNFTDPTGESWLSSRFKGNWAQRMTFVSSKRWASFGRGLGTALGVMAAFPIAATGLAVAGIGAGAAGLASAGAGIAGATALTLGGVGAGAAALGSATVGVISATGLAVTSGALALGSAGAGIAAATGLAMGGGALALGSAGAGIAAATGLAMGGGALALGSAAAGIAAATGLAMGGGALALGSAAAGIAAATGLAMGGGALALGSAAAGIAAATGLAMGGGALALGSAAAGIAAATGLAMGGGAAALASAGAAMAAVTIIGVSAAAALTVQSLALMLCFGCTVGYGLGGLGTSSFNNIHWNESSARAGAVVGGTIQAVVTLAIAYPGLLWDAFKGTMFSAFLQGFSGFSRSNMDFRWYGQDAINAITVESFVLNYIQAGVFKFAVDPIAGCQSNLDCAWKVVKYIYESI